MFDANPNPDGGEHALDMGDLIADAGYYRLTKSEADREYARRSARCACPMSCSAASVQARRRVGFRRKIWRRISRGASMREHLHYSPQAQLDLDEIFDNCRDFSLLIGSEP